ncbi:MAG: sulfatase-like hydrolase/transferase [Planctomycetes bacterium]|nr:sulfatase-like hydrolase/transferase [Planctomycetota bacterium]
MTVRDENLLGWPRDPALLQRQLTDYRALVAHLDFQVGRILATLDRLGLTENTLVVYAADHGLALGSHGLLGKQSLYEHSMRSPVILAGPGVPAGQRREGLCYLFDLMPTILAAAGAAPPANLDGVPLQPLVQGSGPGREQLSFAYAGTQRALRRGDHKLIRLPQIDRELLFDVKNDPDELHDLAGTPAAKAVEDDLRDRLQAAQRALGDDLPWTAAKVRPATIDLTGKRFPPDRWQPPWIVDTYFPHRDPDLAARLAPLAAGAVFEDPAWHHWGASLLQAEDGTWHMFYSRWPSAADPGHQPDSFKDWLWRSEIAHAVADRLDGPWRHVDTALAGRGAGHWDQLSVHNPRVRRFDGHFYLYYISDQNEAGLDTDRSSGGPNWMRVRNSQRTGVAVADSLDGPWRRLDAPLLGPGGPITNVAVNPTVVQRYDGSFLMMVKGDAPGSPQHRYGMALASAPTGPFTWHPDVFDTGFASEDPDVWFDPGRRCYYALVTQTFRNQRRSYVDADGAIGLFRSVDGLVWQDTAHPTAVHRTLRFADGTERRFVRVERPGAVLDKAGELVGITVAVHPGAGNGNSKTVVLQLDKER